MTVVSFSPPTGCAGSSTEEPQEAYTYFVGGSVANCKPPPESGCHRFVIARDGERCDLSPLYNILGETVPLVAEGGAPAFDKDGVYKNCKEKPLLQTRTVRYLGTTSSGATCSQDYCDTAAAALLGA